MSDPRGEEKARDFHARSEEEQQAFLTNTWCDNCHQVDLGMSEPREYELLGTIFIEGICKGCGHVVCTELTDESF
ncbi:hypothetical protein [Nitrincola alkalilacustris]|uniref:hypothetical protein n=1 Tax=Nitrincola alkalilacustris TaxID=1571224 RepID=UPI00124DC5B6|nr:hypothetical protein [Nitrincola alkalilacustris]